MASVNSQQLTLHFLSAMKEQLHAGLAHEATLNLCRAYALEPLLSVDHLVAMPSQNVRAVLSKLEDWCSGARASTSDDVLQRYHIPVTWEQVCDITLSQGLAPHSHPAWCLKIQCQMQEKRYAHVVDTCTKALKIFESRQGEQQPYWLQRGLAYLFLREFRNAVLDYSAAFQANPSTCHAYVTRFQKAYIGSILNAFHDTLAKLETATESVKPDGGPVGNTLRQFIRTFEENAWGDCASRMMKQGKFPEAIKFLTMAIQQLGAGSTADNELQLLFSRAECHLRLDQIDMALADYAAAAAIGEELTRLALVSLPLHQQGTLVARAKRMASDTLAQCRTNSVLKKRRADAQSAETPNLDQASHFFQLLYLMDEEYVDALYSAGECQKLLRRFTEAIRLFTRFLSVQPKSHYAHYNRACCYAECGDLQSALSDYTTSLGLQPTYVQALCGRAWLWIKRDEPRKAVADFSAASAVSTDLGAHWLQELAANEQARVRTKLRGYLKCTLEAPRGTSAGKGALAVADLLTRAWPKDVASHLLYKDMLMSLEKTDESQAVLVRLQQNNPDDPTATAHIAALKMAQGKITSSLEELVVATKTHGEAKLQAALVNVKQEQRAQMAREAHDEGVKRMGASPDDPDVEALFTLAVSAMPQVAWESYLWRAKLHMRLHNLEAALADCTSALAVVREGDSAEVLCWRALVFLHSNKVKAAYLDFLKVLLHNSETLERFVVSQSEEEKHRLLIALEKCTQELFCYYLRSGNKPKSILMLCRLLVHLESTSSLHHSNFADAWIINGNYQSAAEELNEAERYSPENVSVLSRGSLVHMILGNTKCCVLKLAQIARLNLKGLEFTFKLFNQEQKRSLVLESIAQARLSSCDDSRAVLFYTVAVFASDGQNAYVLRVRSQCLERLRCFDQAIGDLSAAIAIGPRHVEDLCARANLNLLNENTMGSCNDFIAAMEMDESAAKGFISRCSAGKDAVCQHFVKAAKEQIRGRNLTGGLKICAYGLKIDPVNADLARFKIQLEYSARKCTIQ